MAPQQPEHAANSRDGADDTTAAALEADLQEMTRLLQGASKALRRRLQPWLSSVEDSLREMYEQDGTCGGGDQAAEICADRDEMSLLLRRHEGGPLSGRARRALTGWMEDLDDQLRSLQGTSSSSSCPAPVATGTTATPSRTAEPENSLAIVGARGVGKRALLRALAGADSDAEAASFDLETKYYSSRIRAQVVEVGDTELTEDAAGLLKDADAVIAIWDTSQPSTFRTVSDVFAKASDSSDKEIDEAVDRVQILLTTSAEGVGDGEAAVGEAQDWCFDHGFELLHCSCAAAELQKLEARLRRARQGDHGGFLRDDDGDEDTLERIAEALESHCWPALQRRSAASQGKQTEKHDVGDVGAGLPLLAFVSLGDDDGQAACERLIGALGTAEASSEALVDTKYYTARIRLAAYKWPADAGREDELRSASGIVLVWDGVSEPPPFWRLRSIGEFLGVGGSTLVAESAAAGAPAQLKLSLLLTGDSCGRDLDEAAQLWCAESGFEHLPVSGGLDAAGLAALQRRWRSDSGGVNSGILAGTPLLANDTGSRSEHACCRIAEALACHMWSSMEPKGSSGKAGISEGVPGRADGSTTKQDLQKKPPKPEPVKEETNGSEMGVDMFQQYAEEMKKVRAIDDHEIRRERACDVAMKLAGMFGFDNEDSD
eukprot:TRINITY_DN50324_c0_g1_i1.p1 TRINITY_DN50324_c0_g1~~TRINITY_DN50324_c0_g1_i1.p1  ORF type:complete len:660 (+),score=163.86 TRINITY_DN50324_c0_g1_i1:67-2046(+)